MFKYHYQVCISKSFLNYSYHNYYYYYHYNYHNNLSIALSATTSSVQPDNVPVASNCIDGVTTYSVCPNGCHPYLCHTQSGGQQWLVITITGYRVNKVVVYNRIDCCQHRINGATITYSNDFAGTSIIHQSSFGSTSSLVYTFDFSTTTYVRIQQTTSEYINLVEVALYYNLSLIHI